MKAMRCVRADAKAAQMEQLRDEKELMWGQVKAMENKVGC
jgi:hypothetical protein